MTLIEASKLVASLGVALNTIKGKCPVEYDENDTPIYAATMVFDGDVLWYVSQLAKELGSTLSEVALSNLEKLEGRAEQGTLAVVSRDLPLEDVLPDGTLLAEKDNTLWRVDPEGTHVDWFHPDGSVEGVLEPSKTWDGDIHRDMRSNNTIMLRLSRVR